jgi:hypothetical protein
VSRQRKARLASSLVLLYDTLLIVERIILTPAASPPTLEMAKRCACSTQSVAKAMKATFEADEFKGSFSLATLLDTLDYVIDNLSSRNIITKKCSSPDAVERAIECDRSSVEKICQRANLEIMTARSFSSAVAAILVVVTPCRSISIISARGLVPSQCANLNPVSIAVSSLLKICPYMLHLLTIPLHGVTLTNIRPVNIFAEELADG